MPVYTTLLRFSVFAALMACLLWAAADAGVTRGRGGVPNPACGPDAAPAAVQAYGLTCETFHDGPFSLGTIDTLNTATLANPAGSCASGSCKWYVDSDSGNTALAGTCPDIGVSCPVTPTSTYSISSGNLVLNRTSAYTPQRIDLLTCKMFGTSLQFVGFTPTPPFYIEFNATRIDTGLDSATAETAVWALPMSYLTGGIRALASTELDFMEGGGGTVQKFVNDMQTTGVSQGQTEWFQEMAVSAAGHANGTLVLPQTRNPNNDGSATGLVLTLNDGTITGSNVVKFGNAVAPTFNGGDFSTFSFPAGHSPDTRTGGFASANTNQYCIFVASGFNKQLTLNYLRVWQLPP